MWFVSITAFDPISDARSPVSVASLRTIKLLKTSYDRKRKLEISSKFRRGLNFPAWLGKIERNPSVTADLLREVRMNRTTVYTGRAFRLAPTH